MKVSQTSYPATSNKNVPFVSPKLPDRSAGVKLQPKVKKCHRKPNTLRSAERRGQETRAERARVPLHE